jgi:hypothetical protein
VQSTALISAQRSALTRVQSPLFRAFFADLNNQYSMPVPPIFSRHSICDPWQPLAPQRAITAVEYDGVWGVRTRDSSVCKISNSTYSSVTRRNSSSRARPDSYCLPYISKYEYASPELMGVSAAGRVLE